jgi:L,D-peptidoglycan transpeptidase YkuD (ErfK/YbiS/YcfS/YnhG family)
MRKVFLLLPIAVIASAVALFVFASTRSSRFTIPPGTKQLIAVRWHQCNPDDYWPELVATVREEKGWKEVRSMSVWFGKNGIAPTGEKREGDGRTPSGVFRIGTAFGYEPSTETKLDYRQATADDFWVDDADSPQYNRWVHGKPQAKSFERLRRDDIAYKYAAVIEYNTNPVVPGRGSAIFLHVSRPRSSGTDGCVAVEEGDMKWLLGWLDKRLNPAIVITPNPGKRGC